MKGIQALLETQNGIGIIDGGFSTALEELGLSLRDQMWTARVLIDEPLKVVEAHRKFYESGADVCITNSYKATVDLYMTRAKHLVKTPDEAIALIRKSVDLAV
jgi:homocysteine S-methyltransferase